MRTLKPKILITTTILLLLIPIPTKQANVGNLVPYYYPNTEGDPAQNTHEVVVPRLRTNWNYQFWDSHYSGNFYVATGADDLSWGREHRFPAANDAPEDAARSIRRTWIEAIQDHECFVEEPLEAGANDVAGTDLQRNGAQLQWGVPRDICVICGIGGCERIDLQVQAGATADGTATNGTVNAGIFRHSNYNDWLGVYDGSPGANVGANAQNTYRSEAVQTVAVIQRTDRFLSGGAGARGVTRWDITSNATYVPWQSNTNLAGVNNGTDVVDIFIVRPSTWAVVTLRSAPYRILDYTNMNVQGTFDVPANPGGGNANRGGFGDYIDWYPQELNVCISQDYTTYVHCYSLTSGGGGATKTHSFNLANSVAAAPNYPDPVGGAPMTPAQIVAGFFRARAIQGIYESPHFGVAMYDRIRVYSIWHVAGGTPTVTAPEHVDWQAEYVEVQGGRHNNWNFNQIWDLTYINTHWYRAGNGIAGWETGLQFGVPVGTPGAPYGALAAANFGGWETYHRKWNVRAGPNRASDLLGGRDISVWRYWPNAGAGNPPVWDFAGTRADWNVDPRERFFFVTHDKGKTVWWKAFFANVAARQTIGTAGGSATSCHPFCQNSCHFPFSKRWCRGDRCAQKNGGADGNPANQAVEFWIRRPEFNFNQPTWPNNVGTDYPIECNTQEYRRYPIDNDMQVANANYDAIWRVNGGDDPNTHWPITWESPNAITVKPPRTAVPYRNTPPTPEPVITTATAGVAPPPYVPVPHNASVVNTTSTKQVRSEASEWWKWALLGLLGLLLLGLLIGALFLIPKNPVRRPIVREVQEVQQKLVQPPPPKVVEYKPTARKTIVEKQIIEKKTPVVQQKTNVVRETVVSEKRGFNPYKQKKVGFRV